MPFSIEWIDTQYIMLCRVWGDVVTADITAITETMFSHYAAVPADAIIHVVVDMTGIRTHPNRVADMVRAFPAKRQENIGWVCLVTTNGILRFLAGSMVQVVFRTIQLRAFSTVPAALDFLRDREANGYAF